MSSLYRKILNTSLVVIWFLVQTTKWLFDFLNTNPRQSENKKLGRKFTEETEEGDILFRINTLTQESNKLLKILIGLRPSKEEQSTCAVDGETDISEDDLSEDESAVMVDLSNLQIEWIFKNLK